jgi:Zn-dependent protease with chaperone function
MVIGFSLAWWTRYQWSGPEGTWSQRWQRALVLFLFPPLLLGMTAIAILCMGPSGQMVMRWEGWFSYGWAIAFLHLALFLGLKLAWEGRQTLRQMGQHPVIELENTSAHLLPTSELYSARIGFWKPLLIVSQGLLDSLDQEHLHAVLTHEQAHVHYHDTFWFFWLGWVRRLTIWLPHTEDLWQELLMLREMRADRLAAQQVDPLVLAESLLLVVSAPMLKLDICAAFSWATSRNRLMERIDSLLAETQEPFQSSWVFLGWLILGFLPLVVVPFHGGS